MEMTVEGYPASFLRKLTHSLPTVDPAVRELQATVRAWERRSSLGFRATVGAGAAPAA